VLEEKEAWQRSEGRRKLDSIIVAVVAAAVAAAAAAAVVVIAAVAAVNSGRTRPVHCHSLLGVLFKRTVNVEKSRDVLLKRFLSK